MEPKTALPTPLDAVPQPPQDAPAPQEIGGGKRTTEPTRYGDWELNGKCVDF